MIIRRAFVILFVLACSAVGNSTQAADNIFPSPILVELFTSEGCSSCPPADAWLKRIDAAQPIPGARLIVLSEHVDYWDHDGWKDPYSSPRMTDRQSNYVHALGLRTAYTPQIIVDGTVNLQSDDAQQITQTFRNAATAPTVPVHIVSATVDPKNPAILRAHIEVDGSSAKQDADVYDVVALDHAESRVLRGENSGRDLTHVAVVESLTKIGKLEKEKSFSRDVQIKLKSGTDPKNIRLIVFVQEPGPGKVIGAALQQGCEP